ncbi:hypothetical protein COCON_G00152430 [Conger conger]|uniref:EGF-like domain-containing protein n=1 Tax=Conger conger TaxID=82655 RepID=A0A9Q1D8I7_CONCO|nr:proheparin-binding EGF-like growth factor [Conger conger]KAJ8262786.1 hypothetical protein COCON_G00152430 [Conger conger]
MNSVLLLWVLSLACCFSVTVGGEVTRASKSEEAGSVTSSGTEIQSSADEDNELEQNEIAELPLVPHPVKKPGKKQKNRKRKNKHKGASHSTHKSAPTPTPNFTSTQVEREDPCLTTHQHYCINGRCKYVANLRETTCVCMMGYDGERCAVQVLKTGHKQPDEEVVQTVLVVIAVVLSLISCCAILLMICAHYRSHKNFLAAYLGPSSEKEKLQTNSSDIVV